MSDFYLRDLLISEKFSLLIDVIHDTAIRLTKSVTLEPMDSITDLGVGPDNQLVGTAHGETVKINAAQSVLLR